VDGGSRGNPGPAGFGVVVEGPAGERLGAYFGYVGVATNNVAEYRGLLAALEHARHQGWRRLWIGSDSELMVRQIRGEYRVKNEGLRPLFERCRRLLGDFDQFTLEHLPRERNAEADRLANRAMNLRSSELPPGVSLPVEGSGPSPAAAPAGAGAGPALAYNAPASAQSSLFSPARSPEPVRGEAEAPRRRVQIGGGRAGGAAAGRGGSRGRARGGAPSRRSRRAGRRRPRRG
jgi:probable phosphoglycerate mutase